jgi:hypothetical protein
VTRAFRFSSFALTALYPGDSRCREKVRKKLETQGNASMKKAMLGSGLPFLCWELWRL